MYDDVTIKHISARLDELTDIVRPYLSKLNQDPASLTIEDAYVLREALFQIDSNIKFLSIKVDETPKKRRIKIPFKK